MNSDAPINQLIESIPKDGTFGIALFALGMKGIALVSLGFFVIFGVVMIRQIMMMSRSVETILAPILHIMGFAYLAASILVWLFAFSVL